MAWRTWALLKERFKTLELIHCQNKIPKGGQAKAKGGRMLPPAPLKETLSQLLRTLYTHPPWNQIYKPSGP